MRRQIKLTLKIFSITFWLSLSYAGAVSNVFAVSRFDSWTADNGLPQNSVYSIIQTRDGYLWFTTLNGLVRYDGARFTVFDKSNSPGIISNRFTTLYEDRDGTLWIGTEENGLTRYKGALFTTYTANGDPLYDKIFSIKGEPDGSLWLLTEGGLARWQNETLTPYSAQGRLRLGIESDPTVYIKGIQRNGGTAFADEEGLHVIRDGRLTTLTIADGLSSLKINSLYRDGRGDLWAGTEDAGLNRLHDGKITVYTTKDGLPTDRMLINSACEDRRGNLWFGIESQLYRLKNGKLAQYSKADGLSGDLIQTIFEDREGSIWIGTASGGLNRFRDEVITTYSTSDGLFADNTYPIYEDRAGAVWIGTWPGLNKYKDGVFIHYTKADGLSSNIISALYEDREGSLWVGTYGAGVNCFRDGRFSTIDALSGADANGILAIHQDRDGRMWFGTTSGLFEYRDGAVTHFTTADGLPHPQITTIYEDRQGNLWLGTRGGLVWLKDQIFTVYTEKGGLSSNHVRAVYEDAEGVLWVGTYDGGLNRFKDGHFTRYTARDGLFDNGVFQILEDAYGNFWMSSNRGIYRASRRELDDFAAGKIRSITSIGYGRSDGMLNAECNGGSSPAGIKTRDGRLWFPTQGGVVVVDPDVISANPLPPPVRIEDFSLDNRSVDFGNRDGVHINPGQERFEIHYTALSFIKPEQVRFKYKLEGLDQDWVDAGDRRTANYSYVPPGGYTFRVTAANSDGVWNTEGASVNVVVYPPFWRTWWFLSLGAGFLIGIAILAHKRRVRQLKRAHDAQEAFSRQLIASQEKERQRIASELHDGLGQSLVIIKNRALLGLGATAGEYEKAQEQLGEISAATSQAIGEMKEIAYDLRPYQLDRLGLTKAIAAMLKRAENSSGIIFSTELDRIDGLCPKDGEINLYRIMQEAVNNIVKHARATEARVLIKREAGHVRITIQDNGQGFSHEANGAAEARDDHHGFGLIGIAERVQMLDGEHDIFSVRGSGTTITIKLNLQDG